MNDDTTPTNDTQNLTPEEITQELYKRNVELAHLYKQVEELNKDLTKANEGQANLIHIINHQIKGYLAKGRIVLSELLTNPVYTSMLSPDGKKLTQQGFEFLTEGTDFIQGILHASSIEAGVMRYEKQLFDLKAMVVEMVEKNKKAADAKGLTLTTVVPDEYCMYNGDERLLREVVGNLVDNAVKYSLQGAIVVTLGASPAAYTISVHDRGVGITDEDRAQLFTRGGRGKNSSKINVDSTGYGLYFAKNVVEAHGGTIAAMSEGENKGSTFTVTLPIEVVSANSEK